FITVPETGALNCGAADRIRTVADDDGNAVTGGRPQAVRHRVDVGVNAGSDVLEIHQEEVDTQQHLRGRLAGLAVKRVDGHAPPGVVAVGRFHHVVLHV